MSYEKLADGRRITDDEIRRLAHLEFGQSEFIQDSSLNENLIAAYQSYHNELPDEAQREDNGQSIQRSTDVSDAIEWILPQIVKSVVESPEAVRFEPLSPEDENQADIEADYIHYYLLNKCNGFEVLYSAAKDALLCKNCITATYHQDRTRSWVEKYRDLTEEALADLMEPDDGTEVDIEAVEERQAPVLDPITKKPLPDPTTARDKMIEHQMMVRAAQAMGQQPPPPPNMAEIAEAAPQMQTLYSVSIRRRDKKGEIVVSPIPVDKFRVRKGWNSVTVTNDTPFCGYETEESAADLVEMGYSPEVIDSLPALNEIQTEVKRAREDVERDALDSDTDLLSRSQRMHRIWRCYMVLDVNGDGYNERIWVTLAGNDCETILGWDEVPENPFATGSAIIQAHKFYGLSIYDKLRYIEAQKTRFLQLLDENLDQQNDPPKSVLEGAANLDDLLSGQATGKLFRIREPGAVQDYPVPQVVGQAKVMLDYYDKMRTERVGADPGMQSISSVFPEESMNSAVERLMAAKEEMVALMVRCLAETWLKNQMLRLRGAVMRNINYETLVHLRNRWHRINPSEWVERTGTVVRIGLGTGDRLEMRSGMSAITEIQQTLKQSGAPVPYSRVYQAVADLVRSFGREPTDYLVSPKELEDPNSPVAREVQAESEAAAKAAEDAQKNDPAAKMAEATIEAERIKATVKQQEAQTDQQQGNLKLVQEMRQHMDKMNLEHRKQLDEMKQFYEDLQFKYDKLVADAEMKGAQIEATKVKREESGTDDDT